MEELEMIKEELGVTYQELMDLLNKYWEELK